MPQTCSIIADIGGTHARFASLIDDSAQLKCVEVLRCVDFVRIDAAIRHYLHQVLNSQGWQLDSICLAVAGAVNGDTMKFVNNHWEFSRQHLSQTFACEVFVINDFTAQALSLPALSDEDILWLRPTTHDHNERHVKAVIGPGTGLGVAALLPSGEVIESEASHCTFAPINDRQMEFIKILRRYYSRISIERIVSGPGLANLYHAASVWTGKEQQLSPEQVIVGAQQGDELCTEVVDEFTQLLGSVCGDIALAMGALGGVYLSGGVLRYLDQLFDTNTFLQHFDAKGRFSQYCRSIPVASISLEHPGLIGAAQFLRNRQGTETYEYECE